MISQRRCSLILSAAVLQLALCRPSTAETSTNLLANPGAETGDLTGWTLSGNAAIDASTLNPAISPNTGSFDFVGGPGSGGTLTQIVQLTGLSGPTWQMIDSGTISAFFGYAQRSAAELPPDAASVTLVFLDAAQGILGSFSNGDQSNTSNWQSIGNVGLPVPAGTRSLKYIMSFTANTGPTTDAYIDDNALSLTYSATTFTDASADHLWSNPANWASGLPAANATALLTRPSGSGSATLDVATPSLTALYLDAPAGMTLTQSTANLTATNQYIGNVAQAAYLQSGATNTATNLFLACYPGSSASYALSGGTLTATNLFVGGSSTGSGGNALLNLVGGSATVGTLKIWSGGTLNIAGSALTVNSLDASTAAAFSMTSGALTIDGGAFAPPSNDSLSLTGGNFQVTNSAIVNLGNVGTLTTSGDFNIKHGGTLTVNGSLRFTSTIIGTDSLGIDAPPSSAGLGLLNVSGDVFLGHTNMTITSFQGTGSSAANIGGTLHVGGAAGDPAARGAVSVLVWSNVSTGGLTVGDSGTGGIGIMGQIAQFSALKLTSSFTINGPVSIGSAGGTGTFSLHANSVLNSNGTFLVGSAVGTGRVSLDTDASSSPTNTATWNHTGSVYIGGTSLAAGTGGGTLTLNDNLSNVTINGSLNLFNKAIVSTSAASGTSLTATTINLAGGTLTGNVFFISTLNQSGGIFSSLKQFVDAGKSLTLSGGTLTASPGFSITGGTFVQTGGTLQGNLAQQSAGSTTITNFFPGLYQPLSYAFSGGTFTATSASLFTFTSFSQSGGLASISSLEMSGSTISQTAGSLSLGTATQSSGTITIGGLLTLTNPATASKFTNLLIAGSTTQWTGRVDLLASAMVIQPTNKTAAIATLVSQIASGRTPSGNWTGNGITSSAVAADQSATSSHNLTLALIDNADLGLAAFKGQSLNASSLLITPALLGDADLSGVVDAADFDRWFANIGASSFSYARADFDLSGIIDAADFDLWFSHIGTSAAVLPNLRPPVITAIPEPATVALVFLAAPLLLRRRRFR